MALCKLSGIGLGVVEESFNAGEGLAAYLVAWSSHLEPDEDGCSLGASLDLWITNQIAVARMRTTAALPA
jgi:hypothetical protein